MIGTTNLSFSQLWTLNWQHFIPAPDRLFSSAGSFVMAPVIGGIYGLIGRVIYPNAGIYPTNYAIWFAIAYQIKECIDLLGNYCDSFMGLGTYFDELEHVNEDQLDLKDQIRYHCWKIIHLKNQFLNHIDRFAVKLLGIRPYKDVTQDNVKDATFSEMCRFRIWKVFRSTITETLSSAIAYQIAGSIGFKLPSRTAVPLFIVIRSIVRDILLVPGLHVYARFCNQLADELSDDDDHHAASLRTHWMLRFLPDL